MTFRLGLRAGLLLGLLRMDGRGAPPQFRTTHLEWVEPGYGTFLLIGLVWTFLWRERRLTPPTCPRFV